MRAISFAGEYAALSFCLRIPTASLFFAVRKSRFLLFRSFLILRFSSIVFSRVNRGMILSGIDEIVPSDLSREIWCTKICFFCFITAVHNSRRSLKNLSLRFKSLVDEAISRCVARNCLATMRELLNLLSNSSCQRTGYGTLQY